jgi:outer membrane murein-binding lipoprotein Lpp
MGKVELNIGTNIQVLLTKVDELNAGMKKLSGDTEEYTKKSTAGFKKTTLSAKELNDEVKAQEKIIKDLEREVEKLAKLRGKARKENEKAYKRLTHDVGIAKRELRGLQSQQQKTNTTAKKGSAIYKKLGTAIVAAFTVGAVLKFA